MHQYRMEMRRIAALEKAAEDAGDADVANYYLDQAAEVCNQHKVPYNNIHLLVASYWPD